MNKVIWQIKFKCIDKKKIILLQRIENKDLVLLKILKSSFCNRFFLHLVFLGGNCSACLDLHVYVCI